MLSYWNPHQTGFVLASPMSALERGRSRAPALQAGSSHESWEVIERRDDYLLRLALPGFSDDEIQVSAERGELKISAQKQSVKSDDEIARFGSLRSDYQGRFRLGKDVDFERIEARTERGILEVRLPRREELKPRTIPLKTFTD